VTRISFLESVKIELKNVSEDLSIDATILRTCIFKRIPWGIADWIYLVSYEVGATLNTVLSSQRASVASYGTTCSSFIQDLLSVYIYIYNHYHHHWHESSL
jgi:hypothetical protein